MTPMEKLLAEAIPTGTFGHALPPREGPRPWTALEQAEHRRVLDEATDGWQSTEKRATADRERHRPAHLRVVPATDSEAAA
ncbi:MAG: hypothetical protein HOV86_02660 [Thermoactinospora sp.]|nr:hypothetical protein [Thermoactinospora sp.]